MGFTNTGRMICIFNAFVLRRIFSAAGQIIFIYNKIIRFAQRKPV